MGIRPALKQRAEELQMWLEDNGRECWAQQLHLRHGTAEQVYWHFGYLSALRDVLTQMEKEVDPGTSIGDSG